MATPAPALDLPVTLADVEAAAARIAGAVVRTPTLPSPLLSARTGANVWLKLENLQHIGAYKERGALNKLLLLPAALGARGVIAASAGNHSQALAFHASRLGIPATIVMPASTPAIKVSQTESHGAEVILFGERFDDAHGEALRLSDARGLSFVHPFDDTEVMAGQGTVALEMLADAPALDTLIVPIGGGGLIAGMGVAARALNPSIQLIGVQAALYPSMYAKFSRQALPCAGDTLAEGIAVKAPGMLTSGIVNQLVDDILLVSERQIEHAVGMLAETGKVVAEGAGATGLAALLANKERFAGRNVGLVVTGGNIDTHLLANVLLRNLARSGRMARLHISLQDRPGALAGVVRLFEENMVNIVEINHQRVFTSLPAKDAAIEVVCEARDPTQLARLTAALQSADYITESRPIE